MIPRGHAVTGKKRRAAAERKQQKEHNRRWMHVEGVLTSGRNVDHRVKRRQKELRGVSLCAV